MLQRKALSERLLLRAEYKEVLDVSDQTLDFKGLLIDLYSEPGVSIFLLFTMMASGIAFFLQDYCFKNQA